jgi:hypothetical protein
VEAKRKRRRRPKIEKKRRRRGREALPWLLLHNVFQERENKGPQKKIWVDDYMVAETGFLQFVDHSYLQV